jgi:hypothetical protein
MNLLPITSIIFTANNFFVLDSSLASRPPFSVENSNAVIEGVQSETGTITVAAALSSNGLENVSISLRIADQLLEIATPETSND